MFLRFVLALIMLITLFTAVQSADAAAATQIAGIGTFDELVVCTENITNSQGANPDFALVLEGDLEGCLYTFVQTAVCTPGGAYIETGEEMFVANGDGSTFSTTYRFEAKFNDCNDFSGQINGRCQHPIVDGSGTGSFEGVKGRLDFRDDLVNDVAVYRGQLKF
jgi:hypothetical protein